MTRRAPGTKASPGAGNPRGLKDLPFAVPAVDPKLKRRARALADALAMAYPDAHCELQYTSPHELLIATILSAQTTDAAVNKATPALFKAFPTPADYARATPAEFEPYIRSLGFFRQKAKSIYAAMTAIVEHHAGEVPKTMPELLELRGVARKTASVVLGNAFGVNDGFVVDTHIHRLAKRFCLVPGDATVEQTERTLIALMPRDRWCELSHQIIWHGRRACTARGKACGEHPICKRFGRCCEKNRG